MATNTRTRTFGVASVVACIATATVIIRSAAGALAKAAAPADGTTATEHRCKPGEKDCKN
ncbi:hypothetical protein ACIPYS_33025 [Kitasatospora sp. NPDC089913]|uniref:hypothetical protein n=1 Tax=Streptomycetaceae TaxID=2062 RepID=UPI00087AFAFD|nr:hypothetical protein [Streptomyces sp. TLI_053]SDT36399.1 hypothetical protein SAMN05216371_2032 [Streptomyces sp. TLI_053]